MLFQTWVFAGFFVLVYALYLGLAHKPQNLLLLVVSYVFYGWWDWRFLGLLWISTGVGYASALLMGRSSGGRRRAFLWISLCTDLGILAGFKYLNFFVGSAAALLQRAGFDAHPAVLGIALPVGISFYTFQSMSYTLDVYRERVAPVRSLGDFALYIAYFPHMVAGPIVRAERLLPQLQKPRTVTRESFESGLLLFGIGLARKLAIADCLARHVDNTFHNDLAASSSLELLRGVLLFGLQIYNDFAGYSDMARGLSRMMGIELTVNFDAPYFATTITEFWRRWHISLSNWLRDYLYIPLGGNRGGEFRTYRNLLITMLLGGLWHGASWNFVIWGGIHGAALAVHRLWSSRAARPRIPAPLSWAMTMAVVFGAWVFFRAEDLGEVRAVLSGILHWHGGHSLWWFVQPLAPVLLWLFLDRVAVHAGEPVISRWTWPARGLTYATLALGITLLRSHHAVPFVYFQF